MNRIWMKLFWIIEHLWSNTSNTNSSQLTTNIKTDNKWNVTLLSTPTDKDSGAVKLFDSSQTHNTGDTKTIPNPLKDSNIIISPAEVKNSRISGHGH